jgi:coiled-coil domain-containing protein 64
MYYFKDLSETSMSKEELVRKAWDVRDTAVKRKNSAEIELAKERISGMQINSQLLEAIQQKIELSQQLEQWQVDMEQLLGEQMKERLEGNVGRKRMSTSAMSTSSDVESQLNNNNVASSGRTSRILSFFQRTS